MVSVSPLYVLFTEVFEHIFRKIAIIRLMIHHFFMSDMPGSETLLIKWLDLNKELKEQDNLLVQSSFSYHFHNKENI